MTTTKLQRNVTQVLRTLLLVYGEDQNDIAAALGVSQAAVSNKMAGKTRWSLDDVELLAEHFGVDDPGRFLNDPRGLLALSSERRPPRGGGHYRDDVGSMSQKYEFNVPASCAA